MSAKRKAESDSRSANRPPRIMRSGGSRAESERDSGFSDASTMDTTDSEDSPRPFVQQQQQQQQQGTPTSSSGAQASQLAVVGGSYSSLSPMIIMNNVLLKQPGDNPPALKPWGFSPAAVEVVQPVVQQSQVVFLQPVVSRQASSKDASRHRRPKKYLPILKSYPKIAPHPGDSSGSSSSSGRGSASSSSSSSASSVSGSERGSSSASGHRDHSQRPKQQRSTSGGGGGSVTPILPLSPKPPLLPSRLPESASSSSSSSPASDSPRPAAAQSEFTLSPAVTQSGGAKTHQQQSAAAAAAEQAASEPLSELSLGDDADGGDTRRKRFCNTYNILNKSGLLDITLRTKELLRQNRRTQSDLDRLKEHTELFLQALRSGDASVCLKLHASLQEEERERAGAVAAAAAHATLKAD